MKILIDEEVVKQALDALVKYQTRQSMDDLESAGYAGDDAITALRSALQADTKVDPVCETDAKVDGEWMHLCCYAAPTPPTNTDLEFAKKEIALLHSEIEELRDELQGCRALAHKYISIVERNQALISAVEDDE